MDKQEVINELNNTITKLADSLQKLFGLQSRVAYMTAEEIMQEMLLILSFGDEIEQKPSILVWGIEYGIKDLRNN